MRGKTYLSTCNPYCQIMFLASVVLLFNIYINPNKFQFSFLFELKRKAIKSGCLSP